MSWHLRSASQALGRLVGFSCFPPGSSVTAVAYTPKVPQHLKESLFLPSHARRLLSRVRLLTPFQVAVPTRRRGEVTGVWRQASASVRTS